MDTADGSGVGDDIPYESAYYLGTGDGETGDCMGGGYGDGSGDCYGDGMSYDITQELFRSDPVPEDLKHTIINTVAFHHLFTQGESQ